MASDGKFGTFGGVFTPSILTILGVIMYLRLPWVVGQAGLYEALGVIVAAHVVSVSTGLSISSIATDKKVGVGGPYYIISRSFGLPIGGAIGLALFLGLSFSISLYIVGFSESMLGTIGIAPTANAIRVCGSITIVALTIITFVSTSLAIKTQYLILVLIAASLVAIFLGHPTAAAAPPVDRDRQPVVRGPVRHLLPRGHRVHRRRQHVRRPPRSQDVDPEGHDGGDRAPGCRLRRARRVPRPAHRRRRAAQGPRGPAARVAVGPGGHRRHLGRDPVVGAGQHPGRAPHPPGDVGRPDHAQGVRRRLRPDQRAAQRPVPGLRHRRGRHPDRPARRHRPGRVDGLPRAVRRDQRDLRDRELGQPRLPARASASPSWSASSARPRRCC